MAVFAAAGTHGPGEIGQVRHVNLTAAVQVEPLQVPAVLGAQGLTQQLPVPAVHSAVPVHVAQSKGAIAGAQGHMLGVVPEGETLGIGDIPLPGEFQGVVPLGEVLHGDVQIAGPASAAQLSAVLVPQGHSRRIAPHLGAAVLPAQGEPPQALSVPEQRYLHIPLPDLLQVLGIVQTERSSHAAKDLSRNGPGGPGPGNGAPEQGRRQQQGKDSSFPRFRGPAAKRPREC